jgi:hypothetical protein
VAHAPFPNPEEKQSEQIKPQPARRRRPGTALATAGCANVGDKSVGSHIDDSTIATKIKSKFVVDKTVEASDIKVTVFEGTVQLSGFAKTNDEVKRASRSRARPRASSR